MIEEPELVDYLVRLVGIVPILMHKYHCREATPPRHTEVTEEMLEEERRRDWFRSAYYEPGKGFHIPSDNLESMFRDGARTFRQGPKFEAGVMVLNDFVPLLVPDGNGGWAVLDKPLESYYIDKYKDLRGVCLGKGKSKVRIDRCRPIFRQWAVEFTIRVDPGISESRLTKALKATQVLDYRPRFGRFKVETLKKL